MSEFKIDGLGVDTIVPDGIEPVEALRCWHFQNGKLISLTNGTEWTPMKPLAATCDAHVDGYSWTVVRGGMTRQQAEQEANEINKDLSYTAHLFFSGSTAMRQSLCPQPFVTALPPGYGYELETHTHYAPDENCTCGIYAVTDEDLLPSGVVYGKVKLWGKIIPGERGVRAQFAYPSEFEVGADLADHPALKAFGVPITVVDRPTPDPGGFITASGGLLAPLLPSFTMARQGISFSTTAVPEPREGRWLRVAVAANLIACAINLVLIVVAVLH